MKIQINSLEALERLIGGDNQLEIDIRNSVVQKFANKHLKAVANGLIERGLVKAAETEIKKEAFESLGFNNVRLTDKYKKHLESQISIMLGKQMREIIEQKLDPNAVEEQIIIKINTRLNELVDKVSKQEIEKKAKALLIEKLNS